MTKERQENKLTKRRSYKKHKVVFATTLPLAEGFDCVFAHPYVNGFLSMLNIRQAKPTKALLIAIVLGTLFICGCIGPRGWPGTVSEGDILYSCTMDGRVAVLNPVNGRIKWDWEPQDRRSRNIVGNSTGFNNSFMSCTSGGRGQFRAGYFYGAPAVTNNTIYVAYYGGLIYAINATKGRETWEYDVKSNIAGGLAVAEGTVFLGSSNGKLYALDAGNGYLKWQFSAENEVCTTPAVVDGVVYFGSLDHSLYAVDAMDGKEKWTFKTGGGIASTPLIADGVVYVGSLDHNFYAINADTGSLRWTFGGTRNWFFSEAAYADGIIYAGSMDYNVYALYAGNGTPAWPQPFKADDQVKSSPVISGRVLVVAAENGKIYGLDLKTGEKRWEFDGIKAKVLSPLYVSGDIVYINSQDNKLHALVGETGSQIWAVSLSE